MKYKTEEAKTREKIIKKFICAGIIVKRIENSICGRHKSIPDIWFFDPLTKIAGWMELKSKNGRLTTGKHSQQEFRDMCILCGINHWVPRSVEEAWEATGRKEYYEQQLNDIEFNP